MSSSKLAQPPPQQQPENMQGEPRLSAADNDALVSLFDSGRYLEMESLAQLLVVRNPLNSICWKALGTAQEELGRYQDALLSIIKAAVLAPGDVEIHYNLGLILKNLGRLEESVTCYQRTLKIRPDYVNAHNNLGVAFQALWRLDDAAASYRRALEFTPDHAEAHDNLGIAMTYSGRPDIAVASYRRALKIKPDFSEAHSSLLFTLNYLPQQSAEVMLSEARRFGDMVARHARPYQKWDNAPDADRCLRVGLVSGDLHNHPVVYFVEGILAALTANASGRLKFIAYASNPHSDALTERIKALCHGWHSAVGLADEALAGMIRDAGIDILIDLSGHTAHNRLPMFAWKPAPVQASWLGYFATTGVAAIDYLIADPWTLPETEDIHFTEKIWRLPETRLCFTPPQENVPVSPLPASSNGYITFGSFGNLTKLNDAVVALWGRILAAVPRSRLYLKSKQLDETSMRHSIIERFGSQGIARERLIMEGFAPRADYLAAYRKVDITLDPFPFTGGTTSAESLWMGVPVLTLAGNQFVSRQGLGLLMNAGLADWVSSDADNYVRLAKLHSGNLPGLAELRGNLRQQVLTSPIFDARRFAGHFESALRGMWLQWCKQHQLHAS